VDQRLFAQISKVFVVVFLDVFDVKMDEFVSAKKRQNPKKKKNYRFYHFYP